MTAMREGCLTTIRLGATCCFLILANMSKSEFCGRSGGSLASVWEPGSATSAFEAPGAVGYYIHIKLWSDLGVADAFVCQVKDLPQLLEEG